LQVPWKQNKPLDETAGIEAGSTLHCPFGNGYFSDSLSLQTKPRKIFIRNPQDMLCPRNQ
jgi:hypothetical protein